MIPKPLSEVTEADLRELVRAGSTERRTLEFKRDLPARSDAGKKEFVHDVVSFANAAGGDILFGVEERDGVAAAVPGVACTSFDDAKLWMESVLRDNVAPRLQGIDIEQVRGFERGPVVLLRVPRSWTGPHMAQVTKGTRFFSRTTAGKFELDVTELRAAFAGSAELGDRLRAFRDRRLGLLLADDGPVRLRPGPLAVLHIIPYVALDGVPRVDLLAIERDTRDLNPTDSGGITGGRFNADGFVVSSGKAAEPKRAYAQAFRSGMLEYVRAEFGRPEKLFNARWLEGEVVQQLGRGLRLLAKQPLDAPVAVFLSLLGMRDYTTVAPGDWETDERERIDRDTLLLPEVTLDDLRRDLPAAMKPTFDTLWQASGRPRSLGYDEAGVWDPGRR
ncbi:MAG: ATP-binding protein [Deltaproteobacteria bacterium]|nr:ATP-binding protein [Myxococcales bacterium]MDP3215771.1 ATP-binding protein [Deltaproteobacteria bacterium]